MKSKKAKQIKKMALALTMGKPIDKTKKVYKRLKQSSKNK